MLSKTICFTFLLLCGSVLSQKFIPADGVLPFTGARFFKHGLGGEKLEIKLDDATWTSNRLPIDTDFEIKLLRPAGLSAATDGNYYPGVEVLIANTKRDTLGYMADVFEGAEGFDPEILKSLSFTLGFNEMSHPGDTCLLFVKFFDTQSPNYLLIDFPVIISDPSVPLEVTSTTYGVSSTDGYQGIASGVELSSASLSMQGSDLVINLPELAGITAREFNAGSKQAWLYNTALEMQKAGSASFSATSEAGKVLVTASISPNPETKYIRFRWESKDGKKVIDFVSRL